MAIKHEEGDIRAKITELLMECELELRQLSVDENTIGVVLAFDRIHTLRKLLGKTFVD